MEALIYYLIIIIKFFNFYNSSFFCNHSLLIGDCSSNILCSLARKHRELSINKLSLHCQVEV